MPRNLFIQAEYRQKALKFSTLSTFKTVERCVENVENERFVEYFSTNSEYNSPKSRFYHIYDC